MSNFISQSGLLQRVREFLLLHASELNSKDIKSIDRAMRDESDTFRSIVFHFIESAGVDVVNALGGIMPNYFRIYDDIISSYKVSPSAVNISTNSFYGCTNLEEVWLNETATIIGFEAFSECIRLKNVHFSQNNKISEIENEAFYHCVSLEEINLPTNLNCINSNTFAFCHKLKRVVLPSTMQWLDDRLFWECDNLTNVNYKGTMSTWNNYVGKSSNWLEGSNVKEIICMDGIIECQ
jgi:hypothetical protein